MTSSYLDFGFGSGDEKISNNKFERFKAKENETYRVSFVWWPETADGKPNLDAPSPRFVGAKRFYIPGVGYVLDKGPEIARIANAPSKMQIATIIAIWPTNRRGELDKVRLQNGDVDVKPWVFAQDKYEQLKRRHEEWPFGQYDLSIACTDTQFQKMDLSPCREGLYRRALENPKMAPISDDITARVRALSENMQSLLARDMTPEQIREKLGQGGGPGVSAAVTATTTSDIDALMDDLVE